MFTDHHHRNCQQDSSFVKQFILKLTTFFDESMIQGRILRSLSLDDSIMMNLNGSVNEQMLPPFRFTPEDED